MYKKTYKKINDLSVKYLEDVIALRRSFHMYPELGFEEYRTSEIIGKTLEDLGYKVKRNIGKTGVVGILNEDKDNITVGIRADMDALPIIEKNDLEFKSKNEGKMHACGHDVHSANLLGVAMILADLKDEIDGRVKLIFQPSEEVNAGALEMIKDGVLEKPEMDVMYGMHVIPTEIGEITCGVGEQTSYTDYFDIHILGKQSHTARPEEGIDAVMVAGQIIVGLQSIITSYISPNDNATFSLGIIRGGSAVNVVADKVSISGMSRATSKISRNTIRNEIETISKNIGQAFGAEVKIDLTPGYPAIINDKGLVEEFRTTSNALFETINKVLDKKAFIKDLDKTFLAGEDFGYFSENLPTCYFHVGAGGFKPQHSSEFMIDENVFKYSMPLMAAVVVDKINNNKRRK